MYIVTCTSGWYRSLHIKAKHYDGKPADVQHGVDASAGDVEGETKARWHAIQMYMDEFWYYINMYHGTVVPGTLFLHPAKTNRRTSLLCIKKCHALLVMMLWYCSR